MKSVHKRTLVTRAAPKASAKAPDLDRYLSTANDDLCQALGVISGELDFALSASDPHSRETAIRVALAGAERATSLARSVRYFSDRTALQPTVTDLSGLLVDTYDLFEREFRARSVQPIVIADSQCFARVDAAAIQHVLSIMFSRALTATPEKGHVKVSLRKRAGQIELSCSDNGLPLEEVPLPSGRDATSLSVGRSIATMHGGSLISESQGGLGNALILRLPQEKGGALEAPDYPRRRRVRRSRVSLLVELVVGTQPAVRTEITTLGAVGAFVSLTDFPKLALPTKDSFVSLRLHYFWNLVLEIPKARVASVQAEGGMQRGIGVEFLELDPRAQHVLDAIVKSHST